MKIEMKIMECIFLCSYQLLKEFHISFHEILKLIFPMIFITIENNHESFVMSTSFEKILKKLFENLSYVFFFTSKSFRLQSIKFETNAYIYEPSRGKTNNVVSEQV